MPNLVTDQAMPGMYEIGCLLFSWKSSQAHIDVFSPIFAWFQLSCTGFLSPVLINVTGLVFENSTYNRKSSTVIKINSTIHFFLEQYDVRIIGRVMQ